MRTRRDYFDMLGGAILVAFGLWFMSYAMNDYNIGTLRRMGPGFFPAVLGGLVAGCGALVLLPAIFRDGEVPVFDTRPFVAIVLALVAFAAALDRIGLVLSTVLLVFIAAMSQRDMRWLQTAILAAALAGIGVLVFSRGLGIPLQTFRWNF